MKKHLAKFTSIRFYSTVDHSVTENASVKLISEIFTLL